MLKKMRLYLFHKFFPRMDNTKKSGAGYWILFLISVAAFFVLYHFIGGVAILVLPFTCTWFAKALNIM